MISKDDTKLEVFKFGDDQSDYFYCLVDSTVSPDGINLDKLKMTDPRNFDTILDEMGCLVMITGDELEELINRGKITKGDLHQELFDLAEEEGIIS
ncbi:MAG: hypothetical protein ACQETE_06830 [Bacteroidota bacterium]